MAASNSQVLTAIELSAVSVPTATVPLMSNAASWAAPSVTLRVYADLFDADLDVVSDALDTAHRKSVSKRGPKRVQPLRKVTG
jgi:hypothetical protein